jgi:DNA-binding transcriptional LysR family regulator
MDFKQLQTFVALAESLHFGQAAEELHIAQPHVSRRIKQLEEDLEVVLFYRDRRNVRLTEAGKVFLIEAQGLLKEAAIAKERARESARGRRGSLTVSMISSATLGTLPAILGEFHRHFPDISLSFMELGSVALLESLSRNEADVGFMHPPIRALPDLEHIVLESEPLMAVLPATHRFAGRDKLSLLELAQEPWVMFPRDNGATIYDRIISLCQKAGFSPRIVQEAGSVPTRLGLVAAGFGVHLVHRTWQTMPFPGIVYIPIEPTARIGLTCYWRDRDRNPILRNFIDVVRRYRLA